MYNLSVSPPRRPETQVITVPDGPRTRSLTFSDLHRLGSRTQTCRHLRRGAGRGSHYQSREGRSSAPESGPVESLTKSPPATPHFYPHRTQEGYRFRCPETRDQRRDTVHWDPGVGRTRPRRLQSHPSLPRRDPIGLPGSRLDREGS